MSGPERERRYPNEDNVPDNPRLNFWTHIAIQEALMGEVVEWMEHVSDEEYGA
jgi:hypothetical protein